MSAAKDDGAGLGSAPGATDAGGHGARPLSHSEWLRAHHDALYPDGREERTSAGWPVEPLYTPGHVGLAGDDVDAWYRDALGLPGAAPFTRGGYPAMYRERPWVMGQYSGQASPKATNQRIRRLLASGQRGFSVALDLPTQNGLDSDHPLALGEVGKVGVPIDSLRDMEDLLDGIDLGQVAQIRTTANAIGPIALALFVVGAERHGFDPAAFRVMFQNDVLKEYVARGTFIFPPRPAMGFSVDVIEYCARHLPHWEPIEFCGYHIRDSGANAVQELAMAVANGIAYIDATVQRGVSIDEFASSLYLFLSAHVEIFEEVAKFRAARRLWARLMEDRFGAQLERSKRLNLFVYTLGSPLTAQEPMNNVVRVAYEALAAVLGGVQTLATSSYDEAIGLPSDEAVHLSLRTQQILAYESGVTRTIDPLGGSYFVEALTDRFESEVRDYLARIEEQGGAVSALESGWIAEQIDTEAYRLQQSIESGERTVVGVNQFVADTPAPDLSVARPVGDVEAEQRARVAEVRREREAEPVRRALRELGQAARRGDNTVPSVIEAVRAYATVGEICSELADVWGRHVDFSRRAG